MAGAHRRGLRGSGRVLGGLLALVLAVGAPIARPASAAEASAAGEREGAVEGEEEGEGYQRSVQKGFDAVVLRPLRAAQLVAGFALFVASTPLTALARTVPEAWEILVLEPYESTFRTPLGQP